MSKDVDLGWSPQGFHSQMHFDDSKRIGFTHTQPGALLQAILDETHAMREEGRNRIAEGRLVANVPWSLHLQWLQEYEKVKHKVSEPAFMMGKLASSDFEKLRVHATRADLIHLSKR